MFGNKKKKVEEAQNVQNVQTVQDVQPEFDDKHDKLKAAYLEEVHRQNDENPQYREDFFEYTEIGLINKGLEYDQYKYEQHWENMLEGKLFDAMRLPPDFFEGDWEEMLADGYFEKISSDGLGYDFITPKFLAVSAKTSSGILSKNERIKLYKASQKSRVKIAHEKAEYFETIARENREHPEYKKEFLDYRKLFNKELGEPFNKDEKEKDWEELLEGKYYDPIDLDHTPGNWANCEKERYENILGRKKDYAAQVSEWCRSFQADDDADISGYIEKLSVDYGGKTGKDLYNFLSEDGPDWKRVFVENLKACTDKLQDRSDLEDAYIKEGLTDRVLSFTDKVFLHYAKKFIRATSDDKRCPYCDM